LKTLHIKYAVFFTAAEITICCSFQLSALILPVFIKIVFAKSLIQSKNKLNHAKRKRSETTTLLHSHLFALLQYLREKAALCCQFRAVLKSADARSDR
jgi:hypothetical protein